jgi:hypothetical protein
MMQKVREATVGIMDNTSVADLVRREKEMLSQKSEDRSL